MVGLVAVVAVGGVLLYLVLRALGTILGREAVGWMPHLSRGIVRRASARLPADERIRWLEEWYSDLAQFEDRPLSAVTVALRIAARVGALARELAPAAQTVRASRQNRLAALISAVQPSETKRSPEAHAGSRLTARFELAAGILDSAGRRLAQAIEATGLAQAIAMVMGDVARLVGDVARAITALSGSLLAVPPAVHAVFLGTAKGGWKLLISAFLVGTLSVSTLEAVNLIRRLLP